nr:hypothetical protein [Tanacetum cinerariifolium]
MSNQSEDIQAAGSDTRPPMLVRTDFESWQQRIRLYCKGKDHGEYVLLSIGEGPFKMGRCRDEIAFGTDAPYLGPERDKVVADLSEHEKDRLRADIRATNILIQGLPRDIYKLINHNTDGKDIWNNVKMLLEGYELTNDRESQLYDEFEHFRQHKGENIYDYYICNGGQVKHGFKKSNHDQLYAYLKQHESHANENKMVMERLNQHSHDPLALVSNVSPYQYPSSSSVPPQSSYIPPVTYQPPFTNHTQLDTGLSPTDELLDNLTKQGRHNRVQGNNGMGNVAATNRGAKNRVGNANTGQGKPIKCYNCNGIDHIARNCNQLKRPQNSDYFKKMMLLIQAQENRVDLDEEQLLFLAGGQTNTFDDDVDEGPVQDMAQNEDNIFQADQCEAFNIDVDEAPTAQTMFMANLSSAAPVYDEAGLLYDSNTLYEVQNHDNCLDDINEYHEEHEMQHYVQPNDIVDSNTEYTSTSNIILVVLDLSQPKKDRIRAKIHTTNILLQGLPRDIYKLINHNTNAKDIWDNVKMLLEGSELTKDDCEYQLYDEFEHFMQHKGENIHDYYVRFTKLINDMRHIKMTMPKIQLNYKFVNNMLPEWAPTAQTMFMANLSSAAPVYDEAGPVYDSDTLSEVQNHDNCLDDINEYHEELKMQHDVQTNDVVDSDTKYTSTSNIISYEQYKELADVYGKRAQFELTERELMIDTHMRMIIKDHNFKEESLQK